MFGAFDRLIVLALFLFSFLPHLAAQENPDKPKLAKELEALETQLRKDEERILKKRGEFETEFERLVAEDVRTKLGLKLGQILGTQQANLRGPNAAETRSAMRKEVFAALKDLVGPGFAAMLDEDMVNNIADRFIESGRVDCARVVQMTVADSLGDEGFAKAFDDVIRPELCKGMAQVTKRRDEVRRRLDAINEAEAARKAGVPPGMIAVPAGEYLVGITEADLRKLALKLHYGDNLDSLILQWRSTEPQQVKLDGYFLDRSEVTCAWWAAYLKENPKGAVPMNWSDGKMPEGWEQRPVTGITFDDAEAFAHWCGRRLPTEAEWEAAARFSKVPAKEPRFWPWGEWDREVRCNFDGAANHAGRRATPPNQPPMLPVGTFPSGRSELGFDDLAGNAYEMTTSSFEPYKGFKGTTINRRRVSSADFNADEITLRGGDCGKRDVVVSSFSRLGFPRDQKAMWVGFRTAASTLRGKDSVDWLVSRGQMRAWLVDYLPLSGDTMLRRSHAELDTANPMAVGALMKGGWDATTALPTRAEYVTIVNRRTDELRDFSTLKQYASAEKSKSVMLGFLHTDVGFANPPLPPGDYFLHWHAAGTVDKGPESPTEAIDRLKAGTDLAVGRITRLPDCFVLERRGGSKPYSIYVESFPPPVVADVQGTRVIANPSSDSVELVYSFPIKGQPKKSFVVTMVLNTSPAEKDATGTVLKVSDAAALK